MTRPFTATFGGPDPEKIMSALLGVAKFVNEPPQKASRNLKAAPPSKNWKKELLTPDEDVQMTWADGSSLGISPRSCTAVLPQVKLAPKPVLDLLSGLPIYLAVMNAHVPDWQDDGYRLPKVGAGHAGVGWGMAFKGPGHERHVVSRRWLERGPYRLLEGASDTTLVQFCDLDADPETALEQAKPGHVWMAAGFMMDEHPAKTEIQGIYTPKDGLLRVVVAGRDVSDRELLDACVARRDRANDKKQPLKNIAYIFTTEKDARANLERLWLRGLECCVADGKGERRLDDDYKPKKPKPPSWV